MGRRGCNGQLRCRRVDILKHAWIVHLDVQHRMRANDCLRAGFRISAPQRVEHRAAEDHRMAMASTASHTRHGAR